MKQYLIHVFIGFDQFVTTLFGGWPDETISSYAWRLELQGKLAGRLLRPMIDWLFTWQGPDHCLRAHQQERDRTQFPPSLR